MEQSSSGEQPPPSRPPTSRSQALSPSAPHSSLPAPAPSAQRRPPPSVAQSVQHQATSSSALPAPPTTSSSILMEGMWASGHPLHTASSPSGATHQHQEWMFLHRRLLYLDLRPCGGRLGLPEEHHPTSPQARLLHRTGHHLYSY